MCSDVDFQSAFVGVFLLAAFEGADEDLEVSRLRPGLNIIH
jgi:hypothetical protein